MKRFQAASASPNPPLAVTTKSTKLLIFGWGRGFVSARLHFGFQAAGLYGDDMVRAWQTGWAEFIALGKSVMLNPNLVELLTGRRDDEIQTHFDWNKADFYRYTPAMLHGTRLGMDFYTPSENQR